MNIRTTAFNQQEESQLLKYKRVEQQALKAIFPTHQTDLNLDFKRWDKITSKYIVEVKPRHMAYSAFTSQYNHEPFLDVYKYQNGINDAKKDNKQFIYIFPFFNNQYKITDIICWNLSDSNFKEEEFKKQIVQCWNEPYSSNAKMVTKEVYYVPLSMQTDKNTHKIHFQK